MTQKIGRKVMDKYVQKSGFGESEKNVGIPLCRVKHQCNQATDFKSGVPVCINFATE